MQCTVLNSKNILTQLHKIPLAVHEFIDSGMIAGPASRDGKDFFKQTSAHQDDKFFVGSEYYEETKAYKNMSYDKGHMAPASNYLGNQ